MSDTTREHRLRNAAKRQGLHLRKSRARDRRALTFGTWQIVRDGRTTADRLSLDQVEAALNSGPR